MNSINNFVFEFRSFEQSSKMFNAHLISEIWEL